MDVKTMIMIHEDLCYKQKGLIKKQQSELRTLNNQIDVIASKYKYVYFNEPFEFPL